MKMKKIGILAFVALFTMSISVSAQDATRQKTTPREMKWTAAQRAEQMAKAREMRENQQATREEMRAERQKQIEANDSELEQIIGKEKMDQWKAIRAERMRNMRNGNGMRGNKPKVGK